MVRMRKVLIQKKMLKVHESGRLLAIAHTMARKYSFIS